MIETFDSLKRLEGLSVRGQTIVFAYLSICHSSETFPRIHECSFALLFQRLFFTSWLKQFAEVIADLPKGTTFFAI